MVDLSLGVPQITCLKELVVLMQSQNYLVFYLRSLLSYSYRYVDQLCKGWFIVPLFIVLKYQSFLLTFFLRTSAFEWERRVTEGNYIFSTISLLPVSSTLFLANGLLPKIYFLGCVRQQSVKSIFTGLYLSRPDKDHLNDKNKDVTIFLVTSLIIRAKAKPFGLAQW